MRFCMTIPTMMLLACESASTDSVDGSPDAAPDPWDGATAPLDPFRERLVVSVGTTTTARLASISRVPALAVWPQQTGGAALLDARYRLGDGPGCLDTTLFPDAVDGVDRQGACPPGEVELDRTHLAPADEVLQVVDDPDGRRVAVLLSGGRLGLANADLDAGNPWDWLRLDVSGALVTDLGEVPTAILPLDGGWWGLVDASLVRWNAEREVEVTLPLSGTGRFLAAGGSTAWVATETGVENPEGVVVEVADARGLAADGEGGVWVVSVVDSTVRHVDHDGSVDVEVAVGQLRGAVAPDPRTGRVYVVVDDGVAVLDGGVEAARYTIPGAIDVVVNGSSEIAVLDDAGRVHVHLDETSLRGPPPLSAWIAAFLENPRAEASVVECEGSEDSMQERAGRASRNRAFLEDVPAVTALAVSPPVALHGKRCKVDEALAAVLAGPRLEPGVLFHDPPDCADQACLDAALAEELDELGSLVAEPRFTAGAAGWETGGDWVAGLVDVGLVRHAFLGLSALPEIAMTDPRAKDALPWEGERSATPWRTSSAAAAGDDDPDGALLLVPGSTLAVFNMSGCAGALQAECRLMDLGGGEVVDDVDLAVADILLHRAAAHRGDAGRDTWYFHLPALEEHDYTSGCAQGEGRIWTGEACEAARLQAWLLDVHARLVEADVVRWGRPSEAQASGG